MSNYDSPEVYVEEVESDSHQIQPAAGAVPAFEGICERGPVREPTLITSFAEFRRVFGGFIPADSLLTYAVSAYFKYVKGRCYVSRVVHYTDPSDPTTLTSLAATVTLKDRAATPLNTLKVSASSDGEWGDDLFIQITDGTQDSANEFNIIVRKDSSTGTILETWRDLSMESADGNYVENAINGVSDYIVVEDLESATAAPNNRPAVATTQLAGGDDGLTDIANTDYIGDVAGQTGFYAFDLIDEITQLAVPGVTAQAVQTGALSYADERADVFVVLDPPVANGVQDIVTYVRDTAAFNSKYGAIYYPNLYEVDPLGGIKILLPPSGHVLGAMAYAQYKFGIQRAPAGEDIGSLRDVVGLEYALNKADRDTLYLARINPIVKKPGKGILIWGQKTVSADTAWNRINVRLLFTWLERSIAEGTGWSVFRDNNSDLWSDLTISLKGFLLGCWQDGMLYDGGSGGWQDAFYVKCDGDLNTQSVVNQLRVITEIGVAPTKAAEFVIFRLTQWDGGRLIEELAASA